MEFRVHQDKGGGWHWEAVSSSGRSLVDSPAYSNEADCRAELERLKARVQQVLQRKATPPTDDA